MRNCLQSPRLVIERALKICGCILFLIGSFAVPVAAKPDEASPRFIQYDRASAVAPLSKRSGRNVMGSVPVDWNNDGQLDLIADQHIYENMGGGVFKKGITLEFLRRSADVAVTDMNGDGLWDIVEGFWAKPELRLFLNTGRPGAPTFAAPQMLATPQIFEAARPPNRKASLLTSIPFTVDWNGDGLQDLLVSARDIWSDYFPFHPSRKINRGGTNFGQIYGELYLLLNSGTRSSPRFSRAEPVLLDGLPLVVFGISSPVTVDFDGDSDLDLVMTQEAGPVLYFENAGTRSKPVLKQPRYLYIDYPGIYSKVSIVDWDNDGLWDILASSEDGEFLFRNSGKAGEPYFSGKYEVLKEIAGDVWVPGFASPDAVDFDGDGDLDLVVGSDDGDYRLFRNIGTRREPSFTDAEFLRFQDGTPLKISVDSGYQPQGPVERFWGYSSPSLVDWDSDGDLDLLSGQIGRFGYLFFENAGNRGTPVWQKPRLLEADRRVIRTTGHARMRPAPLDWNGDGLMDLVAVNDRYEYVLYIRNRDASGALLLQPGELLKFKSGSAVTFTTTDDIVGRRDSVNVCDWDGDGDWDVITGLNSGTAGFMFIENIGDNQKPVFAQGVEMTDAKGTGLRQLAQKLLEGFGHNPNIDVVDWNGDGVLDLLAGQDMGFILFFDGNILKPAPGSRQKR